jgi:FkbM family methyltransferase
MSDRGSESSMPTRRATASPITTGRASFSRLQSAISSQKISFGSNHKDQVMDGIPTNLESALRKIGCDAAARAESLAWCRAIERTLPYAGSIRDDITGPIIDALHQDVGILRKLLSNGVMFDFHYRSKIARELVMSPDEYPDHVWEPQTTRLLIHLGRNAPNVVIGGAYSGDQAILLAKEMARHGKGTIHAFEPNRDQIKMLMRNASNNALVNIHPQPVGLWDEPHASLRLVGDDSFAHSEPAQAGADTFPTTTIDLYGATHGIERIGLIMLDIEGAELRALMGARRYLAQPAGEAPVVVFEVHRSFVDWSNGLANTDIVRLLTGHGYAVFAVRDFNSNVPMGALPIELVPLDTVYLEGPPHGFNMLAVKDMATVAGAPFRMVRGVSPKLLAHKDPALHHPVDGLPAALRREVAPDATAAAA